MTDENARLQYCPRYYDMEKQEWVVRPVCVELPYEEPSEAPSADDLVELRELKKLNAFYYDELLRLRAGSPPREEQPVKRAGHGFGDKLIGAVRDYFDAAPISPPREAEATLRLTELLREAANALEACHAANVDLLRRHQPKGEPVAWREAIENAARILEYHGGENNAIAASDLRALLAPKGQQAAEWWLVIDGDNDVVIGFQHAYACHEHINDALANEDSADMAKSWTVRPVHTSPPEGQQAAGWKLTQADLEEIRDQAEGGVFVEHHCPAMYACAAILATFHAAAPTQGDEWKEG